MAVQLKFASKPRLRTVDGGPSTAQSQRMGEVKHTGLSPEARRIIIAGGAVIAVGLGWLMAETVLPWWEQRRLNDSLASHAWSMSTLKPGETYELASFPVPPDVGSPPTFEVALNRRGVREQEFSTLPPAGVVRIIAIGDSTTFGTGVRESERFTEVLQAHLDQSHPGTFEVLNCGKAGMSARAGRTFYEQHVRGWGASIVVVGLGTNDLRDGQDPMRVTDGESALNTYQQELEHLLRLAAEDQTSVILWTNSVLDQRGENSLRPFNSRARLAAQKYGIPIIDLERLYRSEPATQIEISQAAATKTWIDYWPDFARVPSTTAALYNDMAHPNAAGFKRLADAPSYRVVSIHKAADTRQ